MYSNTAAFASARVRNGASWTRSVLSEAKKLSMGALSRQLPRRLIDCWMPCRSSTARYGPEAYCLGSTSRRNTLTEGVAMRAGRRRSDRALRAVLPRSPGRPGVAQRENRRRFWAAIAAGQSSEAAAIEVGVSPVVGPRWFREAGGMPPRTLAPSSKPRSERSLSFAEREEIALLRARGCGVRETARRLGRAASTISRELRRHARRRAGVSGQHRAVACRAGGPTPEESEACDQRGAADVCAGAPVWRGWWPGRGCGARAGRALERPAAPATAAPPVGQGVEPGADRPPPAARLPRGLDDAHQPRGHLPVALRTGPRRAAPRAD